MREYSSVSPQFWIGKTGKRLRGCVEAQLVAMYLVTNPHSNMLGIYYLPVMYVAHETGLGLEGASKGLQRAIEAGFCSYDSDSEMVWVHEMARFQIGEGLAANDKRVIGIHRKVEALPNTQLKHDFMARYAKDFHFKIEAKTASPSEAPCKPLRSQEQDQEQDQDQDLNHQGCLEHSARNQFSAPLDDYPPDCPLDGTSLAAQMALVLRRELRHGTNAKSDHPLVVEWAASGVTIPQLLAAARRSASQKSGESVPVKYIDKILKSQQQEQDHAERRRRSKSAYDPIIEAQQILRRQAQLEREAREHGQPGVAD